MAKRLRRVRCHLVNGPTLEGYLERRRYVGHYVLRQPGAMLQEHGDAERLRDAVAVEIPAENVSFFEVLTVVAT